MDKTRQSTWFVAQLNAILNLLILSFQKSILGSYFVHSYLFTLYIACRKLPRLRLDMTLQQRLFSAMWSLRVSESKTDEVKPNTSITFFPDNNKSSQVKSNGLLGHPGQNISNIMYTYIANTQKIKIKIDHNKQFGTTYVESQIQQKEK